MKLGLILLFSFGIILVGGLIFFDAVKEAESTETVVEEEINAEFPSLDFLTSLHSFTEREIPTETIYVEKESPKLSLSFLYSPFTSHIGFASYLSLSYFNVGIVYTDDMYISVGLTLTF